MYAPASAIWYDRSEMILIPLCAPNNTQHPYLANTATSNQSLLEPLHLLSTGQILLSTGSTLQVLTRT